VHIDGGDLARYVPYRLVRPFFPETNGAKDHLVNGMVAEMCNTYFAERKPLYRFHGTDSLEFNADWCSYLRDNLSIDELLNLHLLASAYERLYQPQIEFSKQNGYLAEWSYRE
jgi:hypothetical protein